MSRRAWLFLSALTLSACGTRSSLEGLGDRECIPKTQEQCVCADGKTGTRTCSASGDGFSTCSCVPGSGASGAAGKAGSGASGTAGAGNKAGSGTAGTGNKAGSGTAGTGNKAGSGTAGTGNIEQCFNKPGDVCYQCCEDVTGGGVTEYQYLIINECGCGKFAVCPKECTSWCSSQNLDQECIDCLNSGLNGGEECINVFYEQCQQSDSCINGLECAQNCQ